MFCLTNKEASLSRACITLIKHDRHLRTRGRCTKHESQVSVFYISRVLSNVQSVLSHCNIIYMLRLLHFLYDIEWARLQNTHPLPFNFKMLPLQSHSHSIIFILRILWIEKTKIQMILVLKSTLQNLLLNDLTPWRFSDYGTADHGASTFYCLSLTTCIQNLRDCLFKFKFNNYRTADRGGNKFLMPFLLNLFSQIKGLRTTVTV